MPAINPVEEYTHGGLFAASVQPEYKRRLSALPEVEFG